MGRKAIDLTGKRFGRLIVKEIITKNKRTYCKCQCDCGGVKFIRSDSLKCGSVASCGCKLSDNGKQTLKTNGKADFINGTRKSFINGTKKILCTNTSGCTGVNFSRRVSKWHSRITVQGKRHHLGFYDNIEDAITARKIAEEKLLHPILEEYQAQKDGDTP